MLAIEILLDENLDRTDLEEAIRRRWRRVQNIKRIRPGIPDSEIAPNILQRRPGCVFVTTNCSDFWRKSPGDPRYCVVCVVLPPERARVIPVLLRWLFRLPPFQTDAGRRGKVFRVSTRTYEYYSQLGDSSSPEPWPRRRRREKRP